jgi:hypothetical protein
MQIGARVSTSDGIMHHTHHEGLDQVVRDELEHRFKIWPISPRSLPGHDGTGSCHGGKTCGTKEKLAEARGEAKMATEAPFVL